MSNENLKYKKIVIYLIVLIIIFTFIGITILDVENSPQKSDLLSSSSVKLEIDSALSNNTPVFFFFYADRCHSCQDALPIIDELEQNFKGKIVFIQINIDDNPQIAKDFNVYYIPHQIIFFNKTSDGKYVSKTFIGFINKETLENILDSKYAEHWHYKGIALINLGEYKEALIACNKVIELNPQNPEVWKNKGIALINLGEYEEALNAYNKVIELNPQDPEAWKNKGNILNKLGRYEEALKAYNKAIELNPEKKVVVSTDIHLKPKTDGIINQLELNISALIDPTIFDIEPKAIKLNYKFNNKSRNQTFSYNNKSYNGKPIKVDLDQRGDFPFEDYNSTITISSLDENLTDAYFSINSQNKKFIIDAWSQQRIVKFNFSGNKIEITSERANKKVTEWLYRIGLFIIGAYFFSFILIYWNKPYNSDMFSVFNSFSFLFFVALVVAGVRDYIFVSKYARLFFYIALLCFGWIAIKSFRSRKYNKRLEKEEEMYKAEMKEMLKQNDEKINELKKILKTEMKDMSTQNEEKINELKEILKTEIEDI